MAFSTVAVCLSCLWTPNLATHCGLSTFKDDELMFKELPEETISVVEDSVAFSIQYGHGT